MSLLLKYSFHCSKASCPMKDISYRRVAFVQQISEYNGKHCQTLILLQSQKQSFIDASTARFPK